MSGVASVAELRSEITNGRRNAGVSAGRDGSPPFPVLLEKMSGQLKRALPTDMNPDRLKRQALTLYNSNEKVHQCEPLSLLGAVVQCAQLGLELGVLGQAYIVPMWNSKKEVLEATLIPGYRGYISLAMRSGMVSSVAARLVFTKEEFSLTYREDGDKLVHVPIMSGDRGDRRLVYMRAILLNKDSYIEPMTLDEINQIKAASRSRDKHGNLFGPWVDYEDDMWRKSAIRKGLKYVPISVEQLAMAAQLDLLADKGQSQGLDRVIDGDYTIPSIDNDAPASSNNGGTKE